MTCPPVARSSTSILTAAAAWLVCATAAIQPGHAQESTAATSSVTIGGNGYELPRDEKNPAASPPVAVYFHVDRPAPLKLALRARAPKGEVPAKISACGKTFEATITGAEMTDVPLGTVEVKKPGYVKVELANLKTAGGAQAEVEAVQVTPVGANAKDVVLHYVKDNKDNSYYWGHRGPSVHLGYQLPKGDPIEWFYNEVTVEPGDDPDASYYMANGFGEGYFGLQVKSATERWVIFSVWSPFTTDNPNAIPDDHKVKLLKKGSDVKGGEFGGEGAGGKSYWVYPWKSGQTYRFLTRVRPDGQGQTVYSAWIHLPETSQWQLMAVFKRPKTNTYQNGVHSFLENFSPKQGYLGRRAYYGNQWACDTKGAWHEVTEANFTCDAIGDKKFRLDFAGGTQGNRFFLRNGGFFDENVPANTRFKRPASTGKPPVIDFKALDGYDAQ